MNSNEENRHKTPGTRIENAIYNMLLGAFQPEMATYSRYFEYEIVTLILILGFVFICQVVLVWLLLNTWGKKVVRIGNCNKLATIFFRKSFIVGGIVIFIRLAVQLCELYKTQRTLYDIYVAKTLSPATICICVVCYASYCWFSYAREKYYDPLVNNEVPSNNTQLNIHDCVISFIFSKVMLPLLASTTSFMIFGCYYTISNIAFLFIWLLFMYITWMLMIMGSECYWIERTMETSNGNSNILIPVIRLLEMCGYIRESPEWA